MEVYSGDIHGDNFEPDETPEEVGGNIEWSVMREGPAINYGIGPTPTLAYSIEELSTVDFDEIPSRDKGD